VVDSAKVETAAAILHISFQGIFGSQPTTTASAFKEKKTISRYNKRSEMQC